MFLRSLCLTVGAFKWNTGDLEECAVRSIWTVLLWSVDGYAHLHQSQCRWADERVL